MFGFSVIGSQNDADFFFSLKTVFDKWEALLQSYCFMKKVGEKLDENKTESVI